jgi:hypothetical protein
MKPELGRRMRRELWQMTKDAEALVKEAQPFLVAARKHLAG